MYLFPYHQLQLCTFWRLDVIDQSQKLSFVAGEEELSPVFPTQFLSGAVVQDYFLLEKDAADAGYPGERAGAAADHFA